MVSGYVDGFSTLPLPPLHVLRSRGISFLSCNLCSDGPPPSRASTEPWPRGTACRIGAMHPVSSRLQPLGRKSFANVTFKGWTSPRPPLFSPHLSSLRAWEPVHHRILCPAKEDSTLKCFY